MFLKCAIILSLLMVAQILGAEDALAWGPGVHTVIALQCLDNVAFLLPSVAKVIASFPVEFLYGCLAADFFIGKSQTRKAANAHNWEGGFRLLEEAESDSGEAYAYGFLSHLAADVIAHHFFVPGLMKSYPARRRMGHLYWEVKADYIVGPGYTRMAKDVLKMDHDGCDELLNHISGKKRKNGLKAKKHIYMQSVRLSDYFYTTRDFLFNPNAVRWEIFGKKAAIMIDLSCSLVNDFLRHPECSPCLSYNPLGRQNLRLAKGRMLFSRLFTSNRPIRRVAQDRR